MIFPLESGGRKIERTRRTELRADDESCYQDSAHSKRQRLRPFADYAEPQRRELDSPFLFTKENPSLE